MLKSLWRIEYKAVTIEPLLTQTVSEDAREEIDVRLGKRLPKVLDAVPLVIGDRAVITGNTVKGLLRHLISAQLAAAGHDICVQEVKLGKGVAPPKGRIKECKPNDPCFACTWFGTGSRQGALYFSFLMSDEDIDKVLAREPIPLIAIRDDYRAVSKEAGLQRRGAFALLAPVKKDVEFTGWINGENLSNEIIGAIKEIQDISGKGFVQFGGYRTRGMGSMKMEITKVEKYGTKPFKLDESYEGAELKDFLSKCQKSYHTFLKRGKGN